MTSALTNRLERQLPALGSIRHGLKVDALYQSIWTGAVRLLHYNPPTKAEMIRRYFKSLPDRELTLGTMLNDLERIAASEGVVATRSDIHATLVKLLPDHLDHPRRGIWRPMKPTTAN